MLAEQPLIEAEVWRTTPSFGGLEAVFHSETGRGVWKTDLWEAVTAIKLLPKENDALEVFLFP